MFYLCCCWEVIQKVLLCHACCHVTLDETLWALFRGVNRRVVQHFLVIFRLTRQVLYESDSELWIKTCRWLSLTVISLHPLKLLVGARGRFNPSTTYNALSYDCHPHSHPSSYGQRYSYPTNDMVSIRYSNLHGG
jgi:hypothetical protein